MHRLLVLLLIAGLHSGCAGESTVSPTGVREGFVTTPDGVGLYFRVVGSGAETVIAPNALYHGDSLDSLADGRRIVTYDPRGRGRSDSVPADKISLDHLLIDIDTVRQAVGAEKVAIIGWSGPGMEMFVYALRNPQHVTRLVQLAPVAPRFDPYGGMMMEDRERRTDQVARDDLRRRLADGEFADDPIGYCRAAEQITNPPTFANPSQLPLIPEVCQYANEHADNIGRYFGKLFESIVGYDWRDQLGAVSVPRLVIHGEHDNIPLEGNKEWVQGQPNARLLIVSGAAHWPHYEQPEVTLEAIDVFLGGGWPADAVSLP